MSNFTTSPFQPDLSGSPRNLLLGTVAAGTLIFVFLLSLPFGRTKNDSVHHMSGHFLSAARFFQKRYQFLSSNLAKHPAFKFNVLQHVVVVVSGDAARKAFYTARGADLTEGSKLFMGGVPEMKDIAVNLAEEKLDVRWFQRMLAILLRRERLDDLLPKLLEDGDARMKGWGKEGILNPFTDVYHLVFSMTIAMGACRELGQDDHSVKRLYDLYETLEKSATPISLLLPWLPTPARRKKAKATKEIVDIIRVHVERRRMDGAESKEAIDVLIREGNEDVEVVHFILGVLFAGVITTGMQSCWILLFLANAPKWRDQVKAEVQSLLDQHNPTTQGSLSLHQRLSNIPISAWESEAPLIDAVIRETIRLTLTGAALRRNLSGGTIHLGQQVTVAKGEFIAYSTTDVHMDSSIYTNPEVFDPERFLAGREEDKESGRPFPFVGWGAGNHPCSGMRIAKLELKAIIALFVCGYEYEIVDSKGEKAQDMPLPDRDDYFQARPAGEPVFFKFARVVE